MVISTITYPKRLLQYLLAFTCSLTTACCGFHFGWASPNLPILLSGETPIPMTNDESSWVAITYLIGGPCGAAFCGFVLDIFGRKNLLLLSSAPSFASWMIIAFATTLPELLVARFVAGFAEGLVFGAIPVYFSEISDPEIRGFIGCCITTFHMLGVVLANVLGSYLSIKNAALICSAIPLIFVLTFVWMPESPYFLLLKGKKEQARSSLMALKCLQNVDTHLEAISNGIEEEHAVSVRFFDLFTKKYGNILLMILLIRALEQLCGFVAVTFYAQTIFEEVGGSLSPLLSAVTLHGVQIVFSVLSSLVMDKLGRRPLLIVSTAGCCLSMIVAGVYFVILEVCTIDVSYIWWLPLLVLLTYIISYSVGLQSVPVFMVGEIFPTNVKAYATGLSNFDYYIFASSSAKFFQYTKDEYGIYVPFFAFSACCLFGLVFTVYFVPETKNKTLEQIQVELRNKK